ncbi:CMGC/DYRK/DYRK2 protein Kinase, partial [Phytophthora palmivora]
MSQYSSFSMEPASSSSPRSRPRRAQRLLPALTPAPPSSSSTAPHKLEQLQAQQPTDTKKPSSIAHIFFNRRPLDLIRHTTSSLLATGGSSAPSAVVATPPVAEERKFWQPHRPHGEKNGRRRLQQLHKEKEQRHDHKQHPNRRLRLSGDVED